MYLVKFYKCKQNYYYFFFTNLIINSFTFPGVGNNRVSEYPHAV